MKVKMVDVRTCSISLFVKDLKLVWKKRDLKTWSVNTFMKSCRTLSKPLKLNWKWPIHPKMVIDGIFNNFASFIFLLLLPLSSILFSTTFSAEMQRCLSTCTNNLSLCRVFFSLFPTVLIYETIFLLLLFVRLKKTFCFTERKVTHLITINNFFRLFFLLAHQFLRSEVHDESRTYLQTFRIIFLVIFVCARHFISRLFELVWWNHFHFHYKFLSSGLCSEL